MVLPNAYAQWDEVLLRMVPKSRAGDTLGGETAEKTPPDEKEIQRILRFPK